MSRRVVVTGVGLVSPLGMGTEDTWEAVRHGKSGIGPITAFDATEFSCRIAGEVKGFDPAPIHRKKRSQEDGALHPVRHRGVGMRALRLGPEGGRGKRRAGGRLHRQRHRRIRGDRARAQESAGTRAAAHIAVFHSGDDRQPGLRIRFDPHRGEGAELGDGHGLHDERALDRRFVQDHPARGRRRNDLRRDGSLHYAHGRRRVRGHAGALHAQRRPGACFAPVGQGSRRLRGGRRRGHSDSGRAGIRPSGAGRTLWRRSWATA